MSRPRPQLYRKAPRADLAARAAFNAHAARLCARVAAVALLGLPVAFGLGWYVGHGR